MKNLYWVPAFLFLFLSTAVMAQPCRQGGMMEPPPSGGLMMGDGPGPFGPDGAHDKHRKMLEAVRITRMTEELELTDQQIAVFFPRLKEMEAGIREMAQNQRKLIGRLDSLLNAGAGEPELKTMIAEVDNAEIEKWKKMKAFKAKIDGILTVKQKAKMLVFNQKFDEEIRDMVRDIRQKRMKQFKQ